MGSSVSFLDAQTLVPEECRPNLRLIKMGIAPYNWSQMVSYEGPDTAKVLGILSSCVKPKPEPPQAA
jgi:23S rRNA U2552 (ribose-2'-O)-methylase RlmE/FtsJ